MKTKELAQGFSRSELDRFESMLLERRRFLLGDVRSLEDAESESAPDSASSMHPADLGSDRAASDVSLGRWASESAEIQQVDEALERIRDGSYGLCETCGRSISRSRLQAIPYANLCLACKREEEV